MNILVFIVGFAMFGHYGMGDYKFPTKVEACRFVLEVDANYETNTFGYSIEERRNGRLVRRYNYPMGVADQMNRGIDCYQVVAEAEKPNARKRLLKALDKIFLDITKGRNL